MKGSSRRISPWAWVEPSHFAPPPGEVALGSLTPRRALGKEPFETDRKSTRLNSSHSQISYAVFCLKKKKKTNRCCPVLELACYSIHTTRSRTEYSTLIIPK